MTKEQELKKLVAEQWRAYRFGTEKEQKEAIEKVNNFYYDEADYFDQK